MRMKTAAALAAMLALSTLAFGQQITRIAIVDLSKVISAYSKDAQGVKDFELRKSQVQTDIDKMSAEIMRVMCETPVRDRSRETGPPVGAADTISWRPLRSQ